MTSSHRSMQATRANKEAVQELCEEVKILSDIVEKVAATVKQKVDSIPCDSPDRAAVENILKTDTSLDLIIRIDGLTKWVASMLPKW